MNYEEHVLSLSQADIQAIASLRHEDINLSKESNPTKMIQICINTLNSNHISPQEQAPGHFIRKKLKKILTWNKLKEGENKQIEQLINK